jgi:hypothetical protein
MPSSQRAYAETPLEYDETPGFHLRFTFPRDAMALRRMTLGAVAAGFQQLNVKAWLMSRIQIALIFY